MVDFFTALERNPYQAHKEIIANGGYPALREWVQGVAIEHGLCLHVLPIRDREIQKWKDIARILGGNLVDNTSQVKIKREQISKGLWEMIAHVRSAHKAHRGTTEYVVSGCIVRADKMSSAERPVWEKLIGMYNADMKRNHDNFISMKEWMKLKGY